MDGLYYVGTIYLFVYLNILTAMGNWLSSDLIG